MALFKTEEEKQKEHEERIEHFEEIILKIKEYRGKVGHVHQGMSYAGLWGKFDKLIKIGEMYEKGLLSEDEFKMLKEELLTGTKEETPAQSENIVETSENICNNCGAEISPDDAFCSECGTKND